MLYGELLASRFGILPQTVHAVKGGWSAKAYRVDAGKKDYFLKVYDKAQPSVKPWIERIDTYVPILGWLAHTQALHGLIVEPIPSLSGDYKVETADHVFLLFAYVRGSTPGERGLSHSQAAALAEILARLHSFGEDIPCNTKGLLEDTSLVFCEKLESYLDKAYNQDVLSCLVYPEAAMIRTAIAKTILLRDTARLNAHPLVLCHTDAHYNNVIQSDRLVLVDWEDLRLAPAEADLFMYALDPHWRIFWKTYSSIRSDFRIDAGLMRFYLMRRHLDDIWYYVSRVLFDKPNEDEVSRICGRLRNIFPETRRLLSDGFTLDLEIR